MNRILPKNIKQSEIKFPEIDITNPELGKDWEGHFRDMHLHDSSGRGAYIHDLEDYKLGEHNCVLLPVSKLLNKHCSGWTYEDSQELLFRSVKIAIIELNGMVDWYEWNW